MLKTAEKENSRPFPDRQNTKMDAEAHCALLSRCFTPEIGISGYIFSSNAI